MNHVKNYYSKISTGEIEANIFVKAIYKRMVEEMERDDEESSRFYFDEAVGNHAIEFIETFCRHYEGEHAGELVKLDEWQKAFVQNLFGCLRRTQACADSGSMRLK